MKRRLADLWSRPAISGCLEFLSSFYGKYWVESDVIVRPRSEKSWKVCTMVRYHWPTKARYRLIVGSMVPAPWLVSSYRCHHNKTVVKCGCDCCLLLHPKNNFLLSRRMCYSILFQNIQKCTILITLIKIFQICFFWTIIFYTDQAQLRLLIRVRDTVWIFLDQCN